MEEEWRQLKGHPNYLVSSLGRIQNITTNKIYSGKVNNCGYVRFDLCENGKRFVVYGHRAVADAFIPNVENKPCINHIDGNKTNNNVSNLEWCTQQENTIHARDVLHANFGCNKKAIYCIETNTIYASETDAALWLGSHSGCINRVVKGLRQKTLGLSFAYLD